MNTLKSFDALTLTKKPASFKDRIFLSKSVSQLDIPLIIAELTKIEGVSVQAAKQFHSCTVSSSSLSLYFSVLSKYSCVYLSQLAVNRATDSSSEVGIALKTSGALA